LERLGEPPVLLSRRENANIDLELDDSVKSELGLKDVYETDWTYNETKSLFFRILRSVCGSQQIRHCPSIQHFLHVAMRIGEQRKDEELCAAIKQIILHIRTLEEAGILHRQDDYATLRRELVAELKNQENMLMDVDLDKGRLQGVLNNIEIHQSFLQSQFNAYQQYLENIRRHSTGIVSRMDSDLRARSKRKKRKHNFTKYTHSQLEKAGIIVESEAPIDRRPAITFIFSSPSPGEYQLAIHFGRRSIANIDLQYDDLVGRRQANELVLSIELFKLNIDLLLHILKRDFV